MPICPRPKKRTKALPDILLRKRIKPPSDLILRQSRNDIKLLPQRNRLGNLQQIVKRPNADRIEHLRNIALRMRCIHCFS